MIFGLKWQVTVLLLNVIPENYRVSVGHPQTTLQVKNPQALPKGYSLLVILVNAGCTNFNRVIYETQADRMQNNEKISLDTDPHEQDCPTKDIYSLYAKDCV